MDEIKQAFSNPDILQAFGYAFGSEGTKEIFFDAAIQENDFSYCIFSSKKMIELINTRIQPKKRHILLDATFKTCPLGPFTQLLIIYIRVDHQVSAFLSIFLMFSALFYFIASFLYSLFSFLFSLCYQAFPFAFCLMSKKSQVAYEHAFNYIENNIFPLSSAITITTDYEKAMRNALSKINPIARMYACHFHFCQAVKRRATKIDGLVNFIRTNIKAESIYYRLMSLPLLPSNFIMATFEQLKNEVLELKKKCFRNFFAYFENQWIKNVSSILLIYRTNIN